MHCNIIGCNAMYCNVIQDAGNWIKCKWDKWNKWIRSADHCWSDVVGLCGRYWEPGSFKKALTCLLIMHWNDSSDTLIHLILYLILCRYCVWHSKIQSETQLVRKTDIFNTMKTDCSDPTSYGFMKFSSEKKMWDLGVGSYGEVLTPHRNVFHYSLTKKT